jgi:hypothetical protein
LKPRRRQACDFVLDPTCNQARMELTVETRYKHHKPIYQSQIEKIGLRSIILTGQHAQRTMTIFTVAIREALDAEDEVGNEHEDEGEVK